MAAEHLIQDWIDRCYIALERERDLKMEEICINRAPENRPGRKPRKHPEKLAGEELKKAKQKLLEKLYGEWPTNGVVPLPDETDWESQVERAVYNTVWVHNKRAREREQNDGYAF